MYFCERELFLIPIFFAWPIKLTTSTLIHTKAHTCTHPHMHECKRRNIMLLTHFYLTKISADTIMFLLASGQKKKFYNIKFERVNVTLISRALLSSWQCDVRHDSCKCDYLHSSPFHLVHFLDFPLALKSLHEQPTTTMMETSKLHQSYQSSQWNEIE